MLLALMIILICQLFGEVLVRGAGLPMPGPVIGMVLLLAILAIRGRFRPSIAAAAESGSLETTSRGLLAHLSLLFVPAGVGVIEHLDVFATYGLALAASVVLSTVAALLATAVTFVATARWFRVPGEEA
jgi:holin-like protein